MATIASWAPAVALAAAAVAGMLALAGRRQTGAALVLAVVPWLVVAAGHASRPAAQLEGAIVLAIIAVALVSIGYSHQARATRQVERA
jgi:hypothetical protein